MRLELRLPRLLRLQVLWTAHWNSLRPARSAPAITRAQRHTNQTTLEWVARNRACPSLRTAARHRAYANDCIHCERRAVDRGGEEIGGARTFPLPRRLLRDDSRRATGPNSTRTGPSR